LTVPWGTLATVAGMSWKATDAMKERTKLVLEWERRWKEAEGGRVNMAELCRMFGVSRETGYKWVKRFRESNFDVLAVAERSRRPHTSPTAVPLEIEDLVVTARKQWPRWGPRKLRARLVERFPEWPIPSASTIANILERCGLTVPRRRRRRGRAPVGITTPFVGCNAPNDVWCIDFKGWFVTGDGAKCYPLTMIDAYSRYLLRCEALEDPDGKEVQRILDSAFLEFGLPKAIRSDGGPPFASTGAAKLTALSVWLLQLGIRIEIIAPGKPQQNGRLERLHRTLQAETASPPSADGVAQQRRFDLWRREYNYERPHEALRMRRPSTIYERSSTRYPRPLITIDYGHEPFCEVARVDKNGSIKWHRRRVHISSALAHEYVMLDANPDDDRWAVYWGNIFLGHLDESRRDRGLLLPRARRGTAKVTTMSLD
jgi:putative transposase